MSRGVEASVADAADSRLMIQRNEGCFIVPLPANLDADRADSLCERVVAAVRIDPPRAVIFDASSVQLLDSPIAGRLNQAGRTIGVLGVRTILSGLSPALCSALVRLDVSFPDLVKTGNLDHAFEVAKGRPAAAER